MPGTVNRIHFSMVSKLTVEQHNQFSAINVFSYPIFGQHSNTNALHGKVNCHINRIGCHCTSYVHQTRFATLSSPTPMFLLAQCIGIGDGAAKIAEKMLPELSANNTQG